MLVSRTAQTPIQCVTETEKLCGCVLLLTRGGKINQKCIYQTNQDPHP